MARDRELGRLRVAFEQAAGGTATAMLISGDAGVGKTRLTDELAAYARELAGTAGQRDAAPALAHHSVESHALPQALAASIVAADEAADSGAPAETLASPGFRTRELPVRDR